MSHFLKRIHDVHDLASNLVSIFFGVDVVHRRAAPPRLVEKGRVALPQRAHVRVRQTNFAAARTLPAPLQTGVRRRNDPARRGLSFPERQLRRSR